MTATDRLRKLLCRLFGHRPVSVPLGWCPKGPIGLGPDYSMCWATCCERCRHELPVPRTCDLHGEDCHQ